MMIRDDIELLAMNNSIDDNKIKSARDRIDRIKKALDDKYNVVDIWYQGGCELPFEANLIINGEEKVISFDTIDQMVTTIRLLE